MTAPASNVAILGTGIMGSAMARNALAHGMTVHGWSVPLSDAERLAAEGVVVHRTAADAAAAAELVVTMVPDANAILSFATGPDGFLDALAPGAIWIQCSTVGVAPADRLAALAAEHEVTFVDAPVLGSAEPAARGELVILASGEDAALDRCARFFDAVGRRVLRLGAAGAGSRMKIVTNNWIMSAVAAIAETMALAEALGLNGADFIAAVEGTPLDMGYIESKGGMIVRDEFPAQMRLANGAKDARLALEAARAAGLPARVTAAAEELMRTGCELGHADDDMAAAVFAARPPAGGAPAAPQAKTDDGATQ